jgi:hypothetical protein
VFDDCGTRASRRNDQAPKLNGELSSDVRAQNEAKIKRKQFSRRVLTKSAS